MCEMADTLLHRFVTTATSKEMYGPGFMVYNVHSLLHLSSDAMHYGCLDKCSCFPFENHLSTIKHYIRSGKAPIVQLSQRLEELYSLDRQEPVSKKTANISYKPPNDYFFDDNDRCHQVVRRAGPNHLTCKTFRVSNNLFETPVQSKRLGTYVFNVQSSEMTLQKEDLLKQPAMVLKFTRNRLIIQKLLHLIV